MRPTRAQVLFFGAMMAVVIGGTERYHRRRCRYLWRRQRGRHDRASFRAERGFWPEELIVGPERPAHEAEAQRIADRINEKLLVTHNRNEDT